MTRDASPALPSHSRRSFLKLGAAAVAVAHGGGRAIGSGPDGDESTDEETIGKTGLAVGLHSYSLRHLPLESALRALRLNLHTTVVELCPHHLTGLEPADVAATLRRHGVRPWSIGVVTFGTDPNANRRTFETARALGARNLSCDPDPDPEALADLDDLAAEHDVTVAIHPGGPGHRWGTPASLDAAFAGRSVRVGLCADTGHLIRANADPVAVLRRFADRLHAVHLKDFRRSPDGSAWEDVVAGTANLDLAEIARLLATLHRRVPVFVEYEGPDALPWVRQSMDRVRSAAGQVAANSPTRPPPAKRA